VSAKSKRKSWREKLAFDNGLPKVQVIEGKLSRKWGAGTCVIPAPQEVDALMRTVRKGRLTTIDGLRSALAAKHGTTMACPITTGIFAWIAAHAANEGELAGETKTTPWWRTLKTGGELNPKYPGGIEAAAERLRDEGHKVVQKGKRWFVPDFAGALARLPVE
jgi:6-O-methylguanine DNA methyltransferase, DNA binding domain